MNTFLTVLLWGVAILAVLACLIWCFLCISLFRFAFRRHEKQGRKSPRAPTPRSPYGPEILAGIAYADAIESEDVYITAHDGIRLHGRFCGPHDASVTIILFHGYRSFAENDFGCILSHYTEKCRMRVLLVDQRAHGKSEGKYITFGILERRDCVAWAEYVATRFGRSHKIILDGMSMGASTVLMATGLPLPENVIAVIADSGYTSTDAILKKVAKDLRVNAALFLSGVYFLCRHIAKFDPLETDAPTALATSDLPILLVHGLADDFVPCDMGRANHAACRGRAELILVENAGHGMGYLLEPERVCQTLDDFFAHVAN